MILQIMKKYLNIREVSQLLDLKEHIIRYWDSKDPKTNKIRVDGISTKSNGGTRYFNRENINKLEKLKHILYENGNQNPSLSIANNIINSKSKKIENIDFTSKGAKISETKNNLKINQILKKIRLLVE